MSPNMQNMPEKRLNKPQTHRGAQMCLSALPLAEKSLSGFIRVLMRGKGAKMTTRDVTQEPIKMGTVFGECSITAEVYSDTDEL